MGSSYYFEGSIDIEPALNFAEIKKARKAALKLLSNAWDKKYANEDNVLQSYMPLRFNLEEFVRETDEGPLHVTQARSMIPSNYSDGSYSFLMSDLMEAIIQELPGHTWSGTVMSVDSDCTGAVKIVVSPGEGLSTVTEVRGKPMIQWENDDKPTPVDEIMG